MMNLNLGGLAKNEVDQEAACGANLPRATRKELLKIRISTLATSILAMTERAIVEANQIGEDAPAVRTASRTPPAKRPLPAQRTSPKPITTTTTSSGVKARRTAASTSPAVGRHGTPNRARALTDGEDVVGGPGQSTKGSKSHKKGGGRGKHGGSPVPGTDDAYGRLGPDGLSPTVEGASFEEVVRTLKALESPHESTQDRVTRQLRWASPSPDGHGMGPAPEAAAASSMAAAARLTSTTTSYMRSTDDAFQSWLATSATACASSAPLTAADDPLAVLASEGELLYDRCVALSTANAPADEAGAAPAISTRPLSVQELTESLHRLTVGGAQEDVDDVEPLNGDAQAEEGRARLGREPRYYEVLYMLHRSRTTTTEARHIPDRLEGVVEAATSDSARRRTSVDKEAEEVDENARARHRMKRLYAKSVFAMAPPGPVPQTTTSSPISPRADATEETEARRQYQEALMDLLQSSTSEPVRVRLGPLSCARPLIATATAAAAAVKGRYSTELSPCDASPPLAGAQTMPNSSESIPLMPSADRRSAREGGLAASHSPDVARETSGLTAEGGSDGRVELGEDGEDTDGASGAKLAIQRIETWQRHREDVVASRIVNRRRSSVSGLALPAADFYYTSSSLTNTPSAQAAEPPVRKSGDLPPVPTPQTAPATTTTTTTAAAAEENADASDSVTRDATSPAPSENAAPSISSPSWTTSSGRQGGGGGALTSTSPPSRMQPLQPHRRQSAAVQSFSSGTTNNVFATSSTSALRPATSYDVLLSTSAHPSTTSAPSTSQALATEAAAQVGEDNGASPDSHAVRSHTRAPPSSDAPTGALDVIVASDYLTPPHLQMIWQTEEEEEAGSVEPAASSPALQPQITATYDSATFDSALRRASASGGAPPSQVGSVDNPALDSATGHSIDRETSTLTLSPLGPPIVLC